MDRERPRYQCPLNPEHTLFIPSPLRGTVGRTRSNHRQKIKDSFLSHFYYHHPNVGPFERTTAVDRMVEDTLGEGCGIVFPKARDGGDVDRLRKMLEPRYKRYQRYHKAPTSIWESERAGNRRYSLIRPDFYREHRKELAAIVKGEVDLTPKSIMKPVGSLLP